MHYNLDNLIINAIIIICILYYKLPNITFKMGDAVKKVLCFIFIACGMVLVSQAQDKKKDISTQNEVVITVGVDTSSSDYTNIDDLIKSLPIQLDKNYIIQYSDDNSFKTTFIDTSSFKTLLVFSAKEKVTAVKNIIKKSTRLITKEELERYIPKDDVMIILNCK